LFDPNKFTLFSVLEKVVLNAYKRYNYIYLGICIFVFFSLTNVLALFTSLMGFQGCTLEELEIKTAPSFCRLEGAFPFCRKEADMSLYFYYYKRSSLVTQAWNLLNI
jgi:hypothetical protein